MLSAVNKCGNNVSASDREVGLALYEAYKDLTPLQASDKSFWIYLSHKELFDYVRKRYPKENSSKPEDYIKWHWFIEGSDFIKHSLAGLWWAVCCTIEEDATDDKYRYSKYVLDRSSFRIRVLGESQLIRHKEFLIGIIDYLTAHRDEQGNNSQTDREEFLVSYFKRLGGTKYLSIFDRDYFKRELDKPEVHKLFLTNKSSKNQNKSDAEF